MSNNNTKTKVVMTFLLLSLLLLFVFPKMTTTVPIQKAFAEANVIVTPTCGPNSGFNIKFDATGFSSNVIVHWKLIHSDGLEETSQFGSFETDGYGIFSDSTYIEGLSPDIYKVYFFDDPNNDGQPDSGGVEFLSTISIPCGYGIQQNETISSPSILDNNITGAEAATLSDTTMATEVPASSNFSPILARNQTSLPLSFNAMQQPFLDPTIQNQSSSSIDNNSGDYDDAIINFDPLLNRSDNDVTKAASILSDNTALKGMDHQKLITAVNNTTTNATNQISVDNVVPNLKGLQKQQQLHPFQHLQNQQPFTEEQQQLLQQLQEQEQQQQLVLSPLPTPTYPYLLSQQNQSYLPSSSPSNLAKELVGGNGGKDIASASAAGTTIEAPTTPIPPVPLQHLPSPQAATSMLIPSPPYVDTTPPDTLITSAIDNSTGLNIQNGGGTTASNLITLIFGGIDDSGITGYSCNIDNLPTFTCSSPVVLDNNVFQTAVGISGTGSTVHTFQVSATDIAGNTDLTPAIFNWFTINTIVPESNIQPQIVTPEETTIPSTITFPPITAESVPPYVIGPNTIAPPLITPQAILSNTIGPQVVTPQIITPETQTSFER